VENPPETPKEEAAAGKPPARKPDVAPGDAAPREPAGERKDPPTASPSGAAPGQPDQRRVELARDLNNLASEVVVADEWGIFKDAEPGTGAHEPPRIYQTLAAAYQALAAGKLEEVEIALLAGRAGLNRAQNRDRAWRINNHFGLLPILFIAFSALLVYRFVFQWWLGIEGRDIVTHAAFAGMVGAVLRSLYWLQFQTGKGLLRPRWFTTFIVAPPIGAIFGWLVSLLVKTLAQAVSKGAVDTDWKTVSLLAAFAGFKWEWALGWLEETARSIQARTRDKTPTKPKS
jgi:hypothetical protein